jgi:hypothetical protein
MQYSDTTNKSGIIQDIEFLTNLGDGVISGDSTLLKQFTRLINIRYAKVLGKLQLISGTSGAEDTNHTSQQFSTFDIVSGQNDYTFSTDEDGNTITDITAVSIIPSATDTDYVPLGKLTLSDADAQLIMSPNSDNTGTPTGYIEKNGTVYFNTIPDYDKTDGGLLFYRLVPSYFTSADTTKTPGYAEPFHRLLSLGPAHDWLLVNKPDATALITRVEAELNEYEDDLESFTRQRNPTRTRMTTREESTR